MRRFVYAPGATPINADEAQGLIPTWVSTQSELNAVEQENILQAHVWLRSRRRFDVLTDKFLRDLHQRMFGDVWRWAGAYRRTNKNIGIDWPRIPVALRQLLDDVRYWCEHKTYAWDELGARFHHRLVSIHCFANGNGRHARLATDALLMSHSITPFTWGALRSSNALTVAGQVRSQYIAALREADAHKYAALIAFVRS